MKRFNTTGKMIATQHYMVSINRQVNAAARLVEGNMYFCINRGRQYGKTTTLAFLKEHLEKQGYVMFSISFEGLADSTYDSLESLLYASVARMAFPLMWKTLPNLSEASAQLPNEAVSQKDDKLVEENGRKIFLTYLLPIINGVGNYYCEAQTRDLTRTDVVVDYYGQQYVIELKIWRGNSYHERGEQQFADYLDFFHLKTGYLVSFCFNKEKQSCIHDVGVGEKQIVEALV